MASKIFKLLLLTGKVLEGPKKVLRMMQYRWLSTNVSGLLFCQRTHQFTVTINTADVILNFNLHQA